MAHSYIYPPSAIRTCFFGFSEKKGCDVLIRVGNRTVLGHRHILTASSGYIRRELRDRNTHPINQVFLTDVNASAVVEVVFFIYFDGLRTLEIEDFYDLLRTYDVLEVHFPIEDQLLAGIGVIDKKNKPIRKAFSLLFHAEDTKRLKLAEFMKEHILKHVEHFFGKDNDDDFLKISYAHLKEIVDRRYLPYHKLDVLADAIRRWVDHSCKERHQYVVPLLSEVNGELARQLLERHFALYESR